MEKTSWSRVSGEATLGDGALGVLVEVHDRELAADFSVGDLLRL
jgi:hypothetical protein